jgi:tRNA (guanine37-N1)-methyltransferase
MKLYIGLLHYPVFNKNKKKIASAITNFDLHDISRLARTYGIKRFFVITPINEQQRFAERLINHWITGFGAKYNRDRKEALKLIDIKASLDESIREIKGAENEEPLIIATDAFSQPERSLTYSNAIEILNSERSVLLLFGTAWGIHKEVINEADFILEPIRGNDDYNHLSVRTAAGIILDRLTGRYI